MKEVQFRFFVFLQQSLRSSFCCVILFLLPFSTLATERRWMQWIPLLAASSWLSEQMWSRITSASGLTVTARASKPKRTPSEWPLRGGSLICECNEFSSQLPLAIFIICRLEEKSSCLDKSLCFIHAQSCSPVRRGTSVKQKRLCRSRAVKAVIR